jgi:hypothetical protein
MKLFIETSNSNLFSVTENKAENSTILEATNFLQHAHVICYINAFTSFRGKANYLTAVGSPA